MGKRGGGLVVIEHIAESMDFLIKVDAGFFLKKIIVLANIH